MFLALAAEASFKKDICLCKFLIAVKSIYGNGVAVVNEAEKTDNSGISDLVDVKVACTFNAYDIELCSVDSVLTDERVKRIRIAGLCEDEGASLLRSFLYKIF